MAELARRQHGVVARSQLAGIGLGRGAISLRIARGRLHEVHRGVYAVGHLILTDEGRWMAAVLAGGPGAVLSHTSAAAHWGVRPSQTAVVDVTTDQQRSRPGLRFHCSALLTDEVTVRDGIPVTTVPRTLFDLAAVVSPGQLNRAVNEAQVLRLWDSLSLEDLHNRHPRRPGAAALKEILATQDGARITRSELEDRFIAFLDSEGLPRPATNVPMQLGGAWIEVDCVWREQRLIVELDGHATHGTRSAFETDRARDRALVAAGWRVIRITWHQLQDEPDALTRDLRASLTVRSVANLRRA